MIPIYLKIKGLYSYQDQQEINFEPLTDASLFGIFGPVGCGKSSILEAIMFAIYGESERLNSKDDRSYNMMNLNSNELFIEFDCLAGRTNDKFRFVVKQTRNKNNFNDIKKTDRHIYQWSEISGGWMPTSLTSDQIIGLDYTNFRRTIIIPQGNFQEFIELKGKAKSDMMQIIFNLDQYDLSDKTKVLLEATKEKLAEIEGQLSACGEATPDLIEQRQHDLKLVLEDTTRHTKTLTSVETSLQKWDAILTTHRAIEEGQRKLQSLTLQQPAMQQRASRLAIYEQCVNSFRALLQQKSKKQEDLTKVARQVAEKNEAFTKQQTVFKTIEGRLEVLRPQYEQRTQREEQLADYQLFAEIKNLQTEGIALQEKVQKGNLFINESKEKITRLQTQKAQLQQVYESYKQQLAETKEEEMIDAEIIRLNVQQSLQQYANSLVDDEPCPLCGSLHHPEILSHTTNFEELIRHLQLKKQAIRERLKEEEKEIKKTQDEIEREQLIKEKSDQRLASLNQEYSTAVANFNSKVAQLKHLDWEKHKQIATERIQTRIKEISEEQKRIKDETEAAEAQHKRLGEALRTLEGELSVLTQLKQQYAQELHELQQQFDAECLQQNYTDEAAVRAILAQSISIETERKALQQFDNELHTTTTLLNNLKTDPNNQAYDAEAHQQQRQQLLETKQLLAEAQRQEGSLQAAIERLKKEMLTRESLLKQQATWQNRRENLEVLAGLFKGKGFVEYASGVYLQEVCHAANQRFHRMTSQRLHLEVDDKHDFVIRDLLNGGNIRSIKTLSGGQKFQAALALALALADMINARYQSSHNFFFLDEGFGSLDKPSLQLVFETLKSLRKENRIVGVISHVEELQQEIPVHLRIESTEAGSRVALQH